MAVFPADYTPAGRISDGGGSAEEGEDIEVLEVTLDEALAQVRGGATPRRSYSSSVSGSRCWSGASSIAAVPVAAAHSARRMGGG
jgi:hypothetical protein